MPVPLSIPLKAASALLVVDVLSGLFHWLEDSYGRPDWPVTGRLITQANILHHFDPHHFTRHAWWPSARVLVVLVGCCFALVRALGFRGWPLWLMAAIGVNANEIHKWAHRSSARNGWAISALQTLGLLQSPGHHARHHRGNKDSHYCVVTNYANPVLDRLGAWRLLESLILSGTGARRRPDPSLGRDPATLSPPPCGNPACQNGTGRRTAEG